MSSLFVSYLWEKRVNVQSYLIGTWQWKQHFTMKFLMIYLMGPKINPNPKNKILEEIFIVGEEQVNSTKGEMQEGKESMDEWGMCREEKDDMFTQIMFKVMEKFTQV